MKEKIILILIVMSIVIFVLGFAFYWYEWRPLQIRKYCTKKVGEIIKDINDIFLSDIQRLFDICITTRGLK